MKKSTLKPGLLVSLSTKLSGNVSYRVRDVEEAHTTTDGAVRAVWETERTTLDPQEHEEAIKVRSRCRSLITGVCSTSSFGLLCPEDKEEALSAALDEATGLAAEFNRRAALTRIGVYVLVGRIAADDAEAVRAINSEVRELIETMEQGLTRLDVEAVRAAATKAKQLGATLSEGANERLQEAIQVARTTCRAIVRAGEQGAAEVDRAVLDRMASARTMFLDLEDGEEVLAPTTVGRGIDLDPVVEIGEVPLAAGRFDLTDKEDAEIDDVLASFGKPVARKMEFDL